MRPILIILLLVCIVRVASAQEKAKHWIFLEDKLDISAKHTQVEDSYLSASALHRRDLRGEPGMAAQFARQDAPISPVYEAELQQLGFQIKQRSRWLNAVTVWLSEDEVTQIESLPFVRSTRPVKQLSTGTQTLSSMRSPLIAPKSSSNCPSNEYGDSCNQLDVVNAIPAIEDDINGEGISLGFLDTKFGIPPTVPFSHPSLRHVRDDGRLAEVRDFTERDPTQPCNDLDTHGMSVASVAVGYQPGLLIGPGHGATIYGASTDVRLMSAILKKTTLSRGSSGWNLKAWM